VPSSSWKARRAADLDPAILRDSAYKWCFLTAIGLLDAAWIAASDFRLAPGSVGGPAFAAILLIVGARFFHVIRPDPGLFVLVETIAQIFVGFALAGILSYLALSTNHTLIDPYLSAADRALGFDWPGFIIRVQAHPLLDRFLFLAYRGSVPQLLVIAFLLSWREDGRLRELSGTILISLVLAIAVSAALPAISAYPYYGAEHPGIVAEIGVPDLFALRDGSLRLLDLRRMDGLVCFPSFHVVLSLLFVHALRGRRMLFALAIAVNAAIILSTLTAGGHYLVDLFGGAGVAAASVALYRTVGAYRPVTRRSRAAPSQAAV
jgi:membrane-associated phospholipid phosphatase